MIFVSLHYIRRIIFVAIVVSLYELPIVQIFGLIFLQLYFMIALIDWKPYKDPSAQKKEVYNEINYLLVLYFLVLFTG